jgi:PAS domain S-box-containing protein
VDDDEDDYYIISDYISAISGNKFIIDWTNSYNEGKEKILNKDYDLYFVDYRLGNQTGLDLLKEVCSNGCDEPIVLLTGKGNKTIDIQAMQNGATDYLIKSEINTEKIERCIRYSLDRTASLKELKSRENKYRNLFEGSKDAVFIADLKLNFKEVNQASSTLLNASIEDLLSRNLLEFIKDDSDKTAILERLEKSSNIHDLEIKVKSSKSNEEVKSGVLSLVIQANESSEPLVHGIIHDVSNIKKAEIANLQAQKLAANERLVRMLAHEIRNPLNNISLSIENLQFDSDGQNQTQLLDIIQRNSIRINQIITELLNLTKPLELVFEKENLTDLLDESIALSKDRMNLQKINLKKNYPSQPIYISADRSKLIIAFTNILINAIEAMKTTNGELSVDISNSDKIYTVSIRDNGHGIPEEYLGKLFEPLFTLKKNGMGLGLATAFSIIQSHKGAVQVESKVNEGSNFMISFNAG